MRCFFDFCECMVLVGNTPLSGEYDIVGEDRLGDYSQISEYTQSRGMLPAFENKMMFMLALNTPGGVM